MSALSRILKPLVTTRIPFETGEVVTVKHRPQFITQEFESTFRSIGAGKEGDEGPGMFLKLFLQVAKEWDLKYNETEFIIVVDEYSDQAKCFNFELGLFDASNKALKPERFETEAEALGAISNDEKLLVIEPDRIKVVEVEGLIIPLTMAGISKIPYEIISDLINGLIKGDSPNPPTGTSSESLSVLEPGSESSQNGIPL